MSLVKQLTTVSEFEKWQAFFTQKQKQHDKSDWYSAQMTWAIFAAQGAKNLKVKDFLMDFKVPKPKAKPKAKPVKEDPETAWKASQALWLGMLGINPENPDGTG